MPQGRAQQLRDGLIESTPFSRSAETEIFDEIVREMEPRGHAESVGFLIAFVKKEPPTRRVSEHISLDTGPNPRRAPIILGGCIIKMCQHFQRCC